MVCRMLKGEARGALDVRMTGPLDFLGFHSQLGLALIFSIVVPFYFIETKKYPKA